MEVYILEKQNQNTKAWIIQGVYTSYKLAQDNFIYKDGVFRIRQFEVEE